VSCARTAELVEVPLGASTRLEDARGPCIDLASKHDPQKLSPTQTGLLFAVSLVMLVMFYKPGACPTTILQLTYRNAVVYSQPYFLGGSSDAAPCTSCIILFHKLPLLLCPQYGVREEYCDEHVCLFVCPRSYLQNHTSALHQIFFACYLSPWLGPPLAA